KSQYLYEPSIYAPLDKSNQLRFEQVYVDRKNLPCERVPGQCAPLDKARGRHLLRTQLEHHLSYRLVAKVCPQCSLQFPGGDAAQAYERVWLVIVVQPDVAVPCHD